MTDKRPDPKPRKHPQLWQSYQWWYEITEAKKKHENRMEAIIAGKSNMDLGLEEAIYYETMNYCQLKKQAEEMMGNYGKAVGPIWDWVTGIKGIADSLAGQLLAQIDDISKAPTVSALWRYAGKAVVDGKAEKKSSEHFNRRLKSICWKISDSFKLQQTPGYVDIYYAEKARLRELHPEKIIVDGKTKYNDGHLDMMARRKVEKVFLQHLWVRWREQEGLPVSKPYVIDIMGHTKYIE